MAKTFQKYPIVGGDKNTWGTINNNLRDVSLGLISCKLYDSGGSLYISSGSIGLSDSTFKGVVNIDTSETISITGVSSGNWALVEVYLSAGTVYLAATDISGATDENEIPADFTSSYNAIKGGYYDTATRRAVGVIWKTSGGDLGKVVSCLSFEAFEGDNQNGISGTIYKRSFAVFKLITTNFTTSSSSLVDVPLNSEAYNNIKGCSLSSSGNIDLSEGGLYKFSADCGFYVASGGGTSSLTMHNQLYDKTNATIIAPGFRYEYVANTNDNKESRHLQNIYYCSSAIEVSFRVSASRASGGVQAETGDFGGLTIIVEKIDGE